MLNEMNLIYQLFITSIFISCPKFLADKQLLIAHPPSVASHAYLPSLCPSRLLILRPRTFCSDLNVCQARYPHYSNEHKEVQLFQKDEQSMGFSVRGGLEYGCGVFVSEVLPSSKAAQAGLKVRNIC